MVVIYKNIIIFLLVFNINAALIYFLIPKKDPKEYPVNIKSIAFKVSFLMGLFALLLKYAEFRPSLYRILSFNLLSTINLALLYSIKYLLVYTLPFLFLLFIFKFLFFRFVRPLFMRKYHSFFHKKLFETDQKKIKLKKNRFEISKYISSKTTQANRLFFGLEMKSNKPFYIDLKEKQNFHIQIAGSSGSGKTKSVIIPLCYQLALMECPIVFIDGKVERKGLEEDVDTINFFNTLYSVSKDRNFYNFNTLLIQDNDKKYDVLETSATANPLLFSNKPADILDMLVQALDLIAHGADRYYVEIDNKFLLLFFSICIKAGYLFTFEDIVEYIKYKKVRDYLHVTCGDKGAKEEVREMNKFLTEITNGANDATIGPLIGLENILSKNFVLNQDISKLVNVYNPDIDLSRSLKNKDFVLFSLPCGTSQNTNAMLAKMFSTILNHHAALKQGSSNNDLWCFLFEEFGQYATTQVSKMVSTTRSANIILGLSHQNNSQIEKIGEGVLEEIVANSDIKFIFKNKVDADFWSKYFGTTRDFKRTEVVIDDDMITEQRFGRASNREVDSFFVDPNVLRNLRTGQSVVGYTPLNKKGSDAKIINHDILKINNATPYFPKHNSNESARGLYLKKKRMSGFFKTVVTSNVQENKPKAMPVFNSSTKEAPTKLQKKPIKDFPVKPATQIKVSASNKPNLLQIEDI